MRDAQPPCPGCFCAARLQVPPGAGEEGGAGGREGAGPGPGAKPAAEHKTPRIASAPDSEALRAASRTAAQIKAKQASELLSGTARVWVC